MKIFLSIFLFVIIICVKKYDNKSCPNDFPFLSSDIVCSNFSEICFNSNTECTRLLKACDQCPPSNLTILYLSELIKTAKETSNSTRYFYEKLEKIFENKFEFFKVNFFNRQKSIDKNLEKLLPICILILVVLFVVIIIMILENRFKLFTKSLESVIIKDWKKNYNLLQSRKQSRKKQNVTTNRHSNGEVDDDVTSISLHKQISEIKDAIIKISSSMEKMEDRPRKIQFKIIGENKPIEFHVHGYDTVVFIKDLICSEWTKSKQFHYKIMRLKYNGKLVDNNTFLLSEIPFGRDVVKCEIDNSLNEKDFLVLQIKGIDQRNAFLQVYKNDKINKLKDIIEHLTKRNNFEIFSKNNENFTKLIDNETIGNYNLKDKDFIQIVFKMPINLNIESIFESEAHLRFECSNTDKVQSIYDKIKNALRPIGLVLIMDSEYLDKNNFLFQYNVSSDSPIKYCRFNSANELNQISAIKDNDDIILARNLIKNKEIAVKRFSLPAENNFKQNPAFIKEISAFNILKSKEEFVQIDEPFIDKEYLYIPMEYMEKGSLEDFLKPKNKAGNYANENEVINWSRQIVDALDFLHHNNIIHRNLKTSNILLYENSKLKLSSFGLSKYLNDIEYTEAVKGFMQTNYQLSRHLAPEMMGDTYGNKIDIWSFGIVLLEMNNGKSIFPEMNDTDAVMKLEKVTKNEDIKYSLRENTSEHFKDFIKCCLKIEASERSTAEQLKEHIFLN